MKISLKMIATLLILITFVASNFSLPTLYAEKTRSTSIEKDEKNIVKKNHDLKDTFSGKKLERVKASVK